MARRLLHRRRSVMKSNRMRFYKGLRGVAKPVVAFRSSGAEDECRPANLADMPEPGVLPPISPDQVVTDILVATLLRVQQSSNSVVAAAAARFLSALR